MYRTMLKIRRFEERILQLDQYKEIPGWIHSYMGEEAVATGVCLNLDKSDYITSTHRGHGHCIAKGVNLNSMMAELYGKVTGSCKGRGGSMHIADASLGMLGANGIVGGGIPIATGAGLGCKYLKNGRIVVSFFGDGASDQGGFHESLNFASIFKLPVIYVIENNLYAQSFSCYGPGEHHVNVKSLADRAKAYNITGLVVDGMDVIDVYEKIKKIVKNVRDGKGPVLVEALTYRFRGHYEGDAIVYRTTDELAEWKKKDPIPKLANKLEKEGLATKKELESIEKKVIDDLEAAVEFARKSPYPKKEEAMDFIFS
ncbi:MAG: thiamine pyrophosphate-dependent dehydrogenase E1 component subunit alpha [Cyanobacteria bacterium]|nr:thiamine pyrophosphate-dependent dehydrogenase E1 component subunit alpha [Cyanobacteriota bacterium]